jgi:hypothetical chaperone protein
VQAEHDLGTGIDQVVLGRPVRFAGASGPEDSERCEIRLRRAALEAGFSEVSFELEPVAAALAYEAAVGRPQRVFVFDLGGGTLDVSAMRLGSGRQVLVTAGVALGGETFDRRITAGLMLEHFGQGATWGEAGDALPLPSHLTDSLLDWLAVPLLGRPETLGLLRQAQRTSSHPSRIRALESLLINNYGGRLNHAVEGAKVTLSSQLFSVIRLTGEDLDIWQPITRSQYESLIASDIAEIEACVQQALAQSRLRPDEVDAVIRTGGAAQAPCFARMLRRIFGTGKIVAAAPFTTVAAGLAIRAAQVDGRLRA